MRPSDPRGPILRSERLDRALAAARADTATPVPMQRLAARLSVSAVLPAAGGAKAATALRWSLGGKLGVLGVAVIGLATAGAVLRPRPAPIASAARVTTPAPIAARAYQPVVVPVPAEAAEPMPFAAEEAPPPAPVASRPLITSRPLPPARSRRTSPVSRRAVAHAPPIDATLATPASRAPAARAVESAPPAAGPAAPEPAASSVAPAPGPTEARRLLEARALVASDPAGALELIALHEEQFPHSRLAQERELIAVDALIRRGHLGEARARLKAFRQHYPGSAHRRRLEALEAATQP